MLLNVVLCVCMKEKEGDEHLAAINLLICLVGRYFGQSDLIDAS